MKNFNQTKLKKESKDLNERFPFHDLKGREGKKIRCIVSTCSFSLSDVRFLNKNFDCIQKIFYSKGRNSYYLYAPLDFINHITTFYSSNE